MKFNILFFAIFTLSATSTFSQYTDVINSNRPSESQSAFSVGKTVIQIETGINYITTDHYLLEYDSKGYTFDFNLRYGLLKEQLEFTAEATYQNDKYNELYIEPYKRSGLKILNLGAKYLIFDPYKNKVEKVNLYSWKANKKFKWSQLIPAVAVYGGLNLNFSNPFLMRDELPSNFSPRAALITQNIFGGGYVLITNFYVDKITTDYRMMGYFLTFTKGINDQWSVFLENKGYFSDYYADGILSTGAAYLLGKNMQVDVTVNTNFKNTPSVFYGGFGFSWRSDTNYKEVRIKVPKSQSKLDKKMDKKSEKSKKKRMDEVELEKP
jgi:hypothetical protein